MLALRWLLYLLLGIPSIIILYGGLLRLVRHFYKFPMPEFLASLIDNPYRRRLFPPEEMPRRHGLQAGTRVLEVGPGNGRYTVATARYLGNTGQLVAVDIEPKMIDRLEKRLAAEGVTNVTGCVADVHNLPDEDAAYTGVYMITVIGEIPDPEGALREFHRLLAPGGTLAFSEFFPDPDYVSTARLERWAGQAGFKPIQKHGNWWAFTLVFVKD